MPVSTSVSPPPTPVLPRPVSLTPGLGHWSPHTPQHYMSCAEHQGVGAPCLWLPCNDSHADLCCCPGPLPSALDVCLAGRPWLVWEPGYPSAPLQWLPLRPLVPVLSCSPGAGSPGHSHSPQVEEQGLAGTGLTLAVWASSLGGCSG